jgi:IS30 family transposase
MQDYRQYCDEHPEKHTAELDSVEGVKGGAVLLTIHFVKAILQLAFRRESNDSASVTQIFRQLFRTLGSWDYKKILELLLADNGSEFSNPAAIEFTEDGEQVSRLFYCDPSAPGQKGHCENNHEFIRRIIPKGTDLGNYTQGQISLMMNHINSYGRPELNDRSPYEMFAFLYGEELLHKLGVIQIPRNKIILTPKLFKA